MSTEELRRHPPTNTEKKLLTACKCMTVAINLGKLFGYLLFRCEFINISIFYLQDGIQIKLLQVGSFSFWLASRFSSFELSTLILG